MPIESQNVPEQTILAVPVARYPISEENEPLIKFLVFSVVVLSGIGILVCGTNGDSPVLGRYD